jgi:hypothetical protein
MPLVLLQSMLHSYFFLASRVYCTELFILDAAVLIGCCLQLCGGKSSEGVFVGAFLSMSSTAVVKTLS